MSEAVRLRPNSASRMISVLHAADHATEPYGDVIESVHIDTSGSVYVVVLGVRVWNLVLHPMRVRRAAAAASVATVKHRAKVRVRPTWRGL